MRKAISIIIALAVHGMFGVILFAMYEKLGEVGVIMLIPLYLITLSFYVLSGKLDKWLSP